MAIEMLHVDGLVNGPLASLIDPPSAPGSVEIAPPPVADWRTQLPVLRGPGVHLRELRPSDAAALFPLLTADEVSRFISAPPTTVDGFARFIDWTRQRRTEGRHVAFAVVPDGHATAVGLIQLHATDGDFTVAEWGFALGSAWWGKGLFTTGARLVLEFAFEQVGIRRLEARSVTENARGNGALRKLGAVREAELHGSLVRGQRHYDQYLWSILARDWRQAAYTRPAPATPAH